MKKVLVMHVAGTYAPGVIEAMKRAGYKLDYLGNVDHMIHLEFKRTKK